MTMVVEWNCSGGREISALWRRSPGVLGFGAGVVVAAEGVAELVWVTGKEFFVGWRRGLRLGLLLGLLLDSAAEGQRGEREKQERAEEGDVSCRSLLRREDQAVALFWWAER